MAQEKRIIYRGDSPLSIGFIGADKRRCSIELRAGQDVTVPASDWAEVIKNSAAVKVIKSMIENNQIVLIGGM